MRPAATALALSFLLLTSHHESFAAPVSNLAARHRDGQTFLTWTAPAGTGWTYRVYSSAQPIVALSSIAPLGTVGDSTWCDIRLTRILGATCAYAIDSAGAPLAPEQGLFVVTPPAAGSRYYAVTAQAAGEFEDRTIVTGANALIDPVAETTELPRPVYQRSVIKYSSTVEIYTLWTSPAETVLFPAMGNRFGLAYDCGVVRGADGGALMVRPHPYGQNFLLAVPGSGEPGEWRLALDDPLRSSDNHSWWFGYHEGYDVTSAANLPPLAGTVHDYTFRRVEYTIEWARRSFPIDPARIYAYGYSMGGIGSLWLAFERPDLIAAVQAEVPKFDFSSADDPNTTNLWNSTGSFRRQGDRLWGSVGTDLATDGSSPVYDRLNMNVLAAKAKASGIPPVIVFNGKNDRVLGWAEKIPFYASLDRNRLGAYCFWDMRTHNSAGAWDPMRSTRYLYRFRSDRSFPALSNCTADFDPGDGTATGGDSVGVINAFVEWDTTLVDQPGEWSTTLRLRDLTASFGTVRAPDSLRVDVTPRRLQAFRIRTRTHCRYTVTKVEDGATIQSGVVYPDAEGLVTVRGVTVPRSGCVLRLEAGERLGTPGIEPIDSPLLVVGSNPVESSAPVTFTSVTAGMADLGLYDVSGRRAGTLFRGQVRPGAILLRLDATKLPSGVYFLVARTADSRVSRRVVVAR